MANVAKTTRAWENLVENLINGNFYDLLYFLSGIVLCNNLYMAIKAIKRLRQKLIVASK